MTLPAVDEYLAIAKDKFGYGVEQVRTYMSTSPEFDISSTVLKCCINIGGGLSNVIKPLSATIKLKGLGYENSYTTYGMYLTIFGMFIGCGYAALARL